MESGYLILPGFLPEDLVDGLAPEVDRWVDEGWRERSIAVCLSPGSQAPPPLMELELPSHGRLLTYEPLMRILDELMGTPFVFHHLHSDRHGDVTGSKPWHHDHEPNDRDDPDLLMVHALHYLGGLDGSVGHLVLLPGSHLEHADKRARAHLDTAALPGEIVVDRLPPGSTVLMNSALFHARRPSDIPGSGKPRYFVDASYCQVGALWRPVKPFWRHMLARARARALDLDGGRRPELFAERHFDEYTPAERSPSV
ncbi:phytanoyl-CoA dioxygenase family protein [Nocardiopsis alba]|uniref:phytanoyl-CoA dioxygenase family protein n=1 Tax=Nocardiopsis alba TaxID=53437 RepID=UPI00366CBC79